MNKAIFDKVQSAICEKLVVEPEVVSGDTRIFEELCTDSLDLIELVLCLESDFDLQVPEKDYSQLATVRSTVEYIENMLVAKSGGNLVLADNQSAS